MASKLYKKYLSSKIADDSKMYLFKCGIFYVFIDQDARYASQLLNLKLTHLNSVILKCGFPVSSSEKYFQKMEALNLKVEIINLEDNISSSDLKNCIDTQEFTKIINDFLGINIDNLSISQAFDVLYNLQNKFTVICERCKIRNEEKRKLI